MQYTLYELFWLYFLYSFLGWCAEVALAAIARKKFINRGFVTGPLCQIASQAQLFEPVVYSCFLEV